MRSSGPRPTGLRPRLPAARAEQLVGADGRGGWRWTGWAPLAVDPLAALLAASVALGAVVAVRAGVAWRPAGTLSISPLLPPALLLGAVLGRRHLGLDRASLAAWRELWWLGAATLGVVGLAHAVAYGSAAASGQVLVDVVEEELLFRLALPVAAGFAVAAVLGRATGSPAGWGSGPRLVALGTATVVFAVQPGHLGQVSAPWQLTPFLALGLLLTYVVLRTGHILPGIVLHAVLNLATTTTRAGLLPRPLWAAVVVLILVAFALTAELAARRLGVAVRADEPAAGPRTPRS